MDTKSNVNDLRDENDRHTITTYVSDILALERHISQPIQTQLESNEHQQYGEAIAIISRLKTTNDAHIAALDAHLKSLGGDGVSGVKSAWSTLLGGGAAAINKVRKTKVSKSLRDDYTSLSLAAISYTMLNATALGMGDRATAALAKRHLDDVAHLIIDMSKIMPTVVLQELRDDGEHVTVSAAELSAMQTGESWSAKNSGA